MKRAGPVAAGVQVGHPAPTLPCTNTLHACMSCIIWPICIWGIGGTLLGTYVRQYVCLQVRYIS